MPFPTTPLPLVFGIAPGADPVSPSTWNFTDIASDIRAADGVQIQVGRPDEGTQVDATQVRATVDNRSGNYSRVNPLGTWYGQLAKGTPASVAVTRINDTFTRTTSPGLGTDSVSGLSWAHAGTAFSTNGSAALCAISAANLVDRATVADAGGHDVEITHTASIAAVTTGAAWVHGTLVRYIDSLNFYRLHTEFATSGLIICKVTRVVAGVLTELTGNISTGVSYSAGTVIKTRVRVIGSRFQIRAWLNSGSEPTTWTAEADDDTLTGGTAVGLFEWRVVGNTNPGTLTVTIDNYRCDVIRAITPVPEWPVRWDRSGRNVTAPIVGAGVLRRLAQGQAALRSPIYRQLSGLTTLVQGYWPLEDSSDASVAASAVSGGAAAQAADVSFGSDDCPPGAASAAILNTVGSSRITGLVQAWTIAQTGYAALCYLRMPTTVVGAAGVTAFEVAAAGTITRWVIEVNNTSLTVRGYLADGTLSVTGGPTVITLDPTQWWAVEIEAEESGGNVNWAQRWHQVGTATSSFIHSGSYAGTADRITSITARPPVASTVFSHMWAGSPDVPFNTSKFIATSRGFLGETAGDRLLRLAEEEGVLMSIIGDTLDTSPMGLQTLDTLLALLRECEDADQGVLHERGAGLGYLTREARTNGTAVMTLDFDSGHVAEPPEPTDDDQRLRNRIVLTRTGGSTVTAADDASIALDGTYSDELTVNLQTDGQLVDHAYWRLAQGTHDELRWPRIVLNLARNPSLIASWCRMRIGSRITIANPPDAVQGADLDLIVEGWTETLTPYGWDVVLTCSPASPWDTAIADSSTRLADSSSTTLGSGVSSSDTSLTFSTTLPGDVWSTVDEPYDVMIAGERITVTSMGTVSGSGPYTQTATVTRGVNGMAKTQAAGAAIHIYRPAPAAIGV